MLHASILRPAKSATAMLKKLETIVKETERKREEKNYSRPPSKLAMPSITLREEIDFVLVAT